MAISPLADLKERFTNKEGLVKAVRDLAKGDLWVTREGDKLDHAANSRLLRLHEILSDVKKSYGGSREKLVDAIVKAEDRAKDRDYRNRFASWPLPRLYDRAKAAEKSGEKAAKAKKA